MIAPAVLKEYRKYRREHPTVPARYAAQYARWITAEPAIDVDHGKVTELEREGFTVRVSVDYDEYWSPTEWLGTFTESSFHAEERDGRRVYVDHYKNPEAWSEGERIDNRRSYGYISLEQGFRYEDHYEYARDAGMSRSVAADYARECVAADIARMTADDAYALVVTARVFLEECELSSTSSSGIEVGDDYRAESLYLSEVAAEILEEALEDARSALGRLRASPIAT